MTRYVTSPRLAAVLAELEAGERRRAFRAAGERSGGYNADSRVELQSDRLRREASAVLNPLLAPRSVIEVEQ